MPLLFYIWCVLENSFVHFFIFDFLLCVTQTNGRRYLPVWLTGNGLLTLLAAVLQLPGTFMIHIFVLFIFAKAVCQIRGLVAPMTIIFTFYTLTEGYSVCILSWLSSHYVSPTGGKLEQICIPLLLDTLFFCALQIIKKRYAPALGQSVSSCGGILLLPCAMIVCSIRYGLKLDSRHFEQSLSSLGGDSRLSILLILLTAVVIVSVMMETFCRITQLTGQGKTAVLLQRQLNGQKLYMEEAKKRFALCSSFQHDSKNHLLVIAGLLRDKKFPQAEQYTEKLYTSYNALRMDIATGKLVLDILMKEKLGEAKRNHIAVTCHVAVPEPFGIEDTDLCILFANILDNAIAACKKEMPEKRWLSVCAQVKAQLLIIEAVNSTSATKPVPFGTGLQNIRHVAESYHGTMETELENGQFRISVLLCAQKIN